MTNCKISLKTLTGKESKPGYNNAAFKNMFGSTKIKPNLPFSRSDFFKNSRMHIQGMSISGVQQKLSLKENNKHELIVTAEGGEYILKPSPETYPHAAENEHAAMQVSKLLDINTAENGLIAFEGGELAYITKRFDRLTSGEKLHQEDLAQCFDLPSDEKYGKTYEEAGKRLLEVTNGKQAVVLDYIRRIIFAYVIGNDDLHLKNISLQKLPGNDSIYYDKLSPNYDCLFCQAFEGGEYGTHFLALGLLYDPKEADEEFSELYVKYGYYTGEDFIELGKRLGLKEKPVKAFISKLGSSQKKMCDLVKSSYMPEDMKLRANETIKQRIKAIQIQK